MVRQGSPRVETKDTVMNNMQIGDLLDLEKEFTYPCSDASSKITLDCHKLVKVQAEISFPLGEKQGRQEVVEWIEEHNCNLALVSLAHEGCGFSGIEWRAQKEKWGYESPPALVPATPRKEKQMEARRIEIAEIVRRVNDGESEAEIGRSVGESRAVIWGRLDRAGVKINPPEGCISAREFALLHNITHHEVGSLIRRGRLPGRQFKGDWYVPSDAFLACRKCGKPREKYWTYCTPCATALEVESHEASYHREVIERRCRQETLKVVGNWLAQRGMVGQEGSYPHFVRVEIAEIDALKQGRRPKVEDFPYVACGDE